MRIQFQLENLRVGDHLGGGCSWENTTKLDLKLGVKVWTAFNWLKVGTGGGLL
jgi:hypothetical protein